MLCVRARRHPYFWKIALTANLLFIYIYIYIDHHIHISVNVKIPTGKGNYLSN